MKASLSECAKIESLSEGQKRMASSNQKSKWGSGEDGNSHIDYCEAKAFGKAKVLSEGRERERRNPQLS